MYIVVFLLFIAILFKMRFAGFDQFFTDDYLSLNQMKAVKGICALVVVLHHITLRIDDAGIMYIFAMVGYLSVSIFFFYSGYGLMYSFQKKKDYLNGFLLKRLPNVLIPFFLTNVLFLIATICLGSTYTLKEMIFYVFGFHLIDKNCWYIVAIIVFYIAFYIFFKCFKVNSAIMCTFLFLVGYILVCHQLGKGHWWYNSCFPFLVGISWAYKEKEWLIYFQRKYWIKLLLFFSIFCFSFLCIQKFGAVTSGVIVLGWEIVSAVTFTIFCITFLLKFKIYNRVIVWYGKISYELYLIHGLVLYVLRSEVIPSMSDFWYALFTVGISTGAAYLLNLFYGSLMKRYKVFLTRRWG